MSDLVGKNSGFGLTELWSKILPLLLFCVAMLPQVAYPQQLGNVPEEEVVVSQAKMDSILSLIKPDLPDSVKALLYNQVAISTSSISERLKYANMSMQYCSKSTVDSIMLQNRLIIGACYFITGNNTILLPYLRHTALLAKDAKSNYALQNTYRTMSLYYEQVNNNDSMFYYSKKALELCIEEKDTFSISQCYKELAVKYLNRGFYHEAGVNYQKALELDSIVGDLAEYAADVYRIGEMYTVNDNVDIFKAKNYLTKAVKIFNSIEINTYRKMVYKYLAHNALASTYIMLADTTKNDAYADSCFYYNKMARDFFQKSGYADYYYAYLWIVYVDYLKYYKRYNEAVDVLMSMESHITKGNVDMLNNYYSHCRKIFALKGDYKRAYEYMDRHYKLDLVIIRDSIINVISDSKTEQALALEAVERENAEKLFEAETEKLNAETNRLMTLIFSLLVCLTLVSLVVFYIWRLWVIKRKTNIKLSETNKMLDAQNTELQIHKDIMLDQWHAVEEVNSKLLNSIHYAQRIQKAAVPSESAVREIFPDSFVYYRPRDIVSGDFYMSIKCGRYSVMVTADCTGHGIPGAFLSMLGISALKEILATEDDAKNPGDVLDRMRDFIISTLTQPGRRHLDDGMDMTICSLDLENKKMYYAIADQTAVLVRKGEAIKLKGDNMPVGRSYLGVRNFLTQVTMIEPGDMLYMFSDGIQDQLGGETAEDGTQKKFFIRRLMALLAEFADKPLDTQQQTLDKTISDWCGNTPQVDDMTLVGIRVGEKPASKPNIVSGIVSAILLPLLMAISLSGYSQGHNVDSYEPNKHQIDSILHLIKESTPDSLKAYYYNEAANITNNVSTRSKLAHKSLDYCSETDFDLILKNNYLIAYYHYSSGEIDAFLSYMNNSIAMAQLTDNLSSLHKFYRLFSSYYDNVNNSDSMFYYINRALDVSISLNDTADMSRCYKDIGLKYYNRGYLQEAEKDYRKAIELDSLRRDSLGLAYGYYRLGEMSVYTTHANHTIEEAKHYLNKSIAIYTAKPPTMYSDVICMYLAYDALAATYITLAKQTGNSRFADSCYYYNKQACDFFMQSGYDDYYCYVSMASAEYLIFKKKYNEALKLLLSVESKIATNNYDLISVCYDKFRRVYEKLGNYKKAFEYYEKLYVSQKQLTNDSTATTIADYRAEQVVRVEKIKRENAEQIHAADRERLTLDRSRLKTLLISLIIGLILISVLVFYIIRMLRVKKKANEALALKNEEYVTQATELQIHKEIIMEQWRDVETINNKISRSIEYARRIQQAAFVSGEGIRDHFPDSFIFFSPLDVVSGDFYMAVKCGKYSVMITADCTGHGIPGAFLSMLGVSAVKEFMVTEDDALNPGLVLNRMRDFIKSTLVSQADHRVDDGMDMTICCFDFEKMTIHYAIANQTAYIIRNGESIKLKGDSMPVGRYIRDDLPFRTLEIEIAKGDMVYMFSDGIQDQLGGDVQELGSQKKFLLRRLVPVLVDISDKAVDTQCELLTQAINNWRGDAPQVDDMTLVGIRV